MSHTFNDIMEFKDFTRESLNRGDYTQEIEDIKVGINTISNDKLRWDWVEGETLYLVKNAGGDIFIIYQHPFDGFEHYLWYGSVKMTDYNGGQAPYTDTWNMSGGFGGEGGGVSWVREYMVLDSHSLTFMNWINEHPMEAK